MKLESLLKRNHETEVEYTKSGRKITTLPKDITESDIRKANRQLLRIIKAI